MATTKAPKRIRQPKIRPADYAERLSEMKGTEGYRVVAFAGERWHWLLCGLGLRAARHEGYNPLQFMRDFAQRGRRIVLAMEAEKAKNGEGRSIDELVAAENLTEDDLLLEYAAVAYAAFTAFYDVSFDDILARMTVGRLHELQAEILTELRLMAEATAQGRREAQGDEGN